ncbi:MAG: hypothetical protein WCR85_00260 [Sphaerochaeta sp.]
MRLMDVKYRLKSNRDIESEFEENMAAVEAQVGAELRRLTKKYAIPAEDVIEVVEDGEPLYDQDEIASYLGEVGCPICQKGDKIFLGDISEPSAGAGCRLKEGSCEREGGKNIGSFHTHPVGGTTPSIADIECAISKGEEIMCIGGIVDGEYQISCYSPKSHVRKKGTLGCNVVNSRYYPDLSDIPSVGMLEFFREVPPLNAEDILDDLKSMESMEKEIAHRIADYHFIDIDDEDMPGLISEFKEALEMGDIPPEYWNGEEEIEGEMDSLEVFAGKMLRRVEERKKEHLSRDMYIKEM